VATYSYSRVLGTVLDYHIGQVLGLGLGLESLVLGLGFGLAGQVLVNITVALFSDGGGVAVFRQRLRRG